MLPLAPATCHDYPARRDDPAGRTDRAKRNEALRPEIQRIFDANWQVCGVRKIWLHLRCESLDIARCMVARLTMSMTG